MYITINGNKYEHAKRTQTAQRVTYIATDLTEDIIATGSIGEYRNDGFLLREVAVDNYARQIARSGVFTLTNEPEVQPVAPVEDVTWAAMSAAIKEGVNEVE